MMLRPAVFLDRDGVINRNRADHVKSWSEFEFLPGALEALRRLGQLGWPVVVISNQAIVGRGLVSRQAVEEINSRMLTVARSVGGRIDQVMYCPHRAEDGCECRKPRPGLLLRAADQLKLDLSRSFFEGDAESDVMAAQAVGCWPVLVKTGRGAGHMSLLRQNNVMGYYLAEDLTDAVQWILGPGWLTKFSPVRDAMPGMELSLSVASNVIPYYMGYPN